MARKLVEVFLVAFVLNVLWEFAHAGLYVHYQGAEITSLVLLRAALFDASFIAVLAVLFFFTPYFRARLWFVLVFGALFAIGLEWFALSTGRWEYATAMPIIPFLNIGLTPAIQLGITGWMALKFGFLSLNRKRL